MALPALSEDAIVARLDELFEVEFTFLHSEALAAALAGQPAARQRDLLDWTARVASTQTQLAWEFLSRATAWAGEAELLEAWALQAMDSYDRSGLQAAMSVMRDLEGFVADWQRRQVGATLGEHEGVLRNFVQGLAGRRMRLAASDEGIAWTDSETLYLPPLLASQPDQQDNFALYKAICALLWAQVHRGSFRCALQPALHDHPQPQALLGLFNQLETERLTARISAELPGLGRAMARLLGRREIPPPWQPLLTRLHAPECEAEESLALAIVYLDRLPVLPALPWQGALYPERVSATRAARIERERLSLQVWLREQLPARPEGEEAEEASSASFRLQEAPPEQGESGEMTLLLDDAPLAPPEPVRQLLSSIRLDLGAIPPDYLHPAGPDEYDPQAQTAEQDPDAVWQGTYHEEGASFFDEWDHGRQHYRKRWCVVREKPVTPVDDDFIPQTLATYGGLLAQLRRTFEAMREADTRLRRQADGEEVDLDALVEAMADSRHGGEFSWRLYSRMQRSERDIAVIFMVDMSGSTRGWINQAQREALVLLCEALERLGDRYGIYGFSGTTRKRCEIYPIKTLDEPYGPEVQGRISGIRPQDYTRMGFAIRYLSHLLRETEARTRLLVTLSDGKPDDYSDYRGEYGIEDTRRALLEARRDGIHPYCITIDEQGGDYLPHMYGPAAYTVISEVRELPFRLSNIYRQLTRPRG